jgi:NADPH:quinone reductase-like Zn-dependent oxidoreductase
MRAVRFHEHGGPEVLRYESAPDPSPGPTEVRVRVRAAALNHLDVWLRKGLPGITVPLPKIGGCDIAGEVESRGSLCTRVAVGQRILVSPGVGCGQCAACLRGEDNLCSDYQIIGGYRTDGGCAEYVCVPEANCLPLPEGMDPTEAAALPVAFLTAWNMVVRQARLKAGEQVVIMAAGSGVGTAALQIAKLSGARVIAVAGTEEKLARAKTLGADAGINYASQDLGREIRRLAGKRGVDVVIDHVGGGSWDALVPALARGGRLATCGATAGYEARVDIRYLFSKSIALLGALMGRKVDLLEILCHVAAGRLRPVVDRRLSLAECAEGHRLLERREVFGKIVLQP